MADLAIFADVHPIRRIGGVFARIINILLAHCAHQFNDWALVLLFAGFFDGHIE